MPNSDFEALRNAVETKKELYTIFDRISLGNATGRLNNLHKPRKLTDKNIVAETGQLLLEDLENDLQKIKDLNAEAQVDSFYYLLQKYGWRIGDPESTGEKSVAVAFCDSYRLKKTLEGHENFILLKGDLTGIQKYIYGNIQPKRAGGLVNIAKKLRGRSIIVSLLTDFLANVILKELGLPAWHLLFAGGGHFNLLLPNSPQIQDGLETLTKVLELQMSKRFGDDLQIALAWQNFSKKEIEENIGQCFTNLNSELEKQKHQQQKSHIRDRFYPKGGSQEYQKFKDQIEQWEINIGERFPRRKLVIETVSEGPIPKNNQFLQIATFEILFEDTTFPELTTFELQNNTYSLIVAEDFGEAREFLSEIPGLISAQLFTINDTDFLPEGTNWGENIGFGFRFLGRTVPTKEDEKTGRERPQTFEEIAEADELKMLGALRLDVDDLGFIFSRGIKDASLGEIICLSREMQYFFSAHLDQLAAQKKANGYEHDLYLIYSGGDDAFAVGKWDNVIHFTKQLRADFQDFVFYNQDVHFSAGIFIGNPHYPVGRFSTDAGKLQKDAKEIVKNEFQNRKNRISIFNHVMEWDEFTSKIDLGETFFKALDDKENDSAKFNSAFVYRILNLVKSSFYERTGRDQNGNSYRRGTVNMERFARNVGALRYLFARHGYDEKRIIEKVGELEKALLGDFLKSFNFGDDEKIRSTRDYLVALNYAIFKKRGTKNSNNKTENKND